VGSLEYGDEPTGSGATDLVKYRNSANVKHEILYHSGNHLGHGNCK
jgi:hypothetical protein